jgi:hypothetical protein
MSVSQSGSGLELPAAVVCWIAWVIYNPTIPARSSSADLIVEAIRELAAYVKKCRVKAVFLNNAGVGKEEAGIRGLPHYEAEDVLACAVDHRSAEIGIARDTYESGIIRPPEHTCGFNRNPCR